MHIIDWTINSAIYQEILKDNVWGSVFAFELSGTWVKQQDNDHMQVHLWLANGETQSILYFNPSKMR